MEWNGMESHYHVNQTHYFIFLKEPKKENLLKVWFRLYNFDSRF